MSETNQRRTYSPGRPKLPEEERKVMVTLNVWAALTPTFAAASDCSACAV